MLTSRTLGAGLAAAALAALLAAPAARAGTNDYTYHVSFTTPSSLVGQSGTLGFLFNPDSANAAPATIVASNLTYSSGWSINYFGSSTVGDASLDFFSQSVTINNTDAENGVLLGVNSFGDSAGFDIHYTDPPGTDSSDFLLKLQGPGQADASLLDLRFAPSGQVFLVSGSPGLTITPGAGSPSPVPEASSVVSLGLMLALGGLAVARRRKVRA